MGFDKEELYKAANLPNDQFARLIYAVMRAAGSSQAEAAAAMMQAGNIKRRIATANESELQKLSEAISPETVASIRKTLEEREKGNGNR